jgi:hypothetical protein
MFNLKEATVYYGASAYPLNGLPERFQTIESLDALNLGDLADTVGTLTGFRRDFHAQHIARQEYPGVKLKDGRDCVIPEHIYASANGYGIRWERA